MIDLKNPTIEDLLVVKRNLRKYIGMLDIHGLGIGRSKETIVVYVNKGTEVSFEQIKNLMEKELRGIRLVVIEESSPKFQ